MPVNDYQASFDNGTRWLSVSRTEVEHMIARHQGEAAVAEVLEEMTHHGLEAHLGEAIYRAVQQGRAAA